MRRLPLLLLFLFLLPSAPAAAVEEPAAELATLRHVMAERLGLMEAVARYKWSEGLPVEDLEREAAVLAMTVEQAVAEGLDPAAAARVVAAQIVAAKAIQSALFAEWRAAGAAPFAEAPDLIETLRPEIGRLTGALIAALKAADGRLDDCAARRALSPLPQSLAAFPAAGAVAVQGVLGDAAWCP